MNRTQIQELKKAGFGTKQFEEAYLREMINSIWAYGGPNISDYEWDRYIAKYYNDDDAILTEDEVRAIAEDQLEHLNTHCYTVPAGTDSEGVSYNTTIDDTEIPAK